MTEDDARNLSPNNRVIWRSNMKDAGFVKKTDMAGVLIKWDDGQEYWLDYKDAEAITLMTRLGG